MRDRFQFYPNYDFFNCFKPQGFISFGFKHYDKKVVSYMASKQDMPIVLQTLSERPAVLRLLANLVPEAKLCWNPLAPKLMESSFSLTKEVVDFDNLSASTPLLLLNIRTWDSLSGVLVHGSTQSLFQEHHWAAFNAIRQAALTQGPRSSFFKLFLLLKGNFAFFFS